LTANCLPSGLPSPDHAPLREEARDDADDLVCTYCATTYPIRDGIPVLLVDDATPGPNGIGVAADRLAAMFDESAIETEESVDARDPSRLVYGHRRRPGPRRGGQAAEQRPRRRRACGGSRGHRPGVEALSSMAAGADAAAVVRCDTPVLPRWVGAADALLVASSDGRHPRLAALVDQAS
jgi:hypothetical protein